MKVEAIVYQSSAGTTRRYARQLSELSRLPALPLKQAKRRIPGRPVLFMSWICAGLLMNYERASSALDIRGVCAVGIGPEEMARKELREHQGLEGDGLFFLPGAFQMKRLGFWQRRTMGDMERALAFRVRHSRQATQADRDAYDMLKNGADNYDAGRLEPVLAWLSEAQELF